MRVLTLHQPWASLIAALLKLTETRDWAAPDALIGQRIAIHAARRQPRFSEWNEETQAAVIGLPMPLGAVVATAVLEGCVQVVCSGFGPVIEEDDSGPEKVWVLPKNAPEPYQPYQMDADPYGDYSEGRWIWLLKDIRAVDPPVEARGFQGGVDAAGRRRTSRQSKTVRSAT